MKNALNTRLKEGVLDVEYKATWPVTVPRIIGKAMLPPSTKTWTLLVVTHCLYATARPKNTRNRVADGGPTRKYKRLRMQWTTTSRTRVWNNSILGSCTVD